MKRKEKPKPKRVSGCEPVKRHKKGVLKEV
jgi:hypothetical protein